jgi:putative membrane protein
MSVAINPYNIAVIIIAMVITHTIFNFVPSIFMGAPDPSTALSVLPGHRLLLQGHGLEAIYLTIIGGVGAMLLTFMFFPLVLVAIPYIYQNISSYIHFILAAVAVVMIISEPGIRKLYAAVIFTLSGILGFIMLNSLLIPSSFVLFPIFTGLFGMSHLLISLNIKTRIPKQKTTMRPIPRKLVLSGIIKGLFSGSILGVLPGLGAAQSTVLTQQITRRKNTREFLISVGAINTIVAMFSLVSLYTIMRPRSGAAVAVEKILTNFGFNELLLLLAVAMIATGLSSILLLKTLRRMVSLLERVNYTKLTLSIIIFLIILTIIFTGPLGLLVLGVSTAIGLLAPLFGTKRSLAMGSLMLPLIFFYAGFVL